MNTISDRPDISRILMQVRDMQAQMEDGADFDEDSAKSRKIWCRAKCGGASACRGVWGRCGQQQERTHCRD